MDLLKNSMTSTERKILKCLWDAKGRAPVNVVSRNVGIGTDYTRLICRSLARAGYLKFADASVCYLLTKGSNHFQRNNESVGEQPSEASQIILVSNTPISSGDDHDSDNKENAEHEDESGGQAVNDSELDQALEGLSSASSPKEEEIGADKESLQIELAEETKTIENTEESSKEQEIPIALEPEEKAQATAISEETPQAVFISATTLPEQTKTEVEEEMKQTQTVVAESKQSEVKKETVDELKDITPQEKEKQTEAVHKSTEGLVEARITKLIDSIGIGFKKAASWINQARQQTGVMNEGGRKDKK
ncbi:MAG: hypothetical protein AAB975_04975 [Patescibacteria group bacterium]